MEDARIRYIVAKMALGETSEDGICIYDEECEGQDTHSFECPVTLARQLLKDNGTPLKMYVIAFELLSYFTKEWHRHKTSYVCFSPSEALAQFEEDYAVAHGRNPHIESEREL